MACSFGEGKSYHSNCYYSFCTDVLKSNSMQNAIAYACIIVAHSKCAALVSSFYT